MANHNFCSECGTKYENSNWPKTCNHCNHIFWKNPIPVATILQPVYHNGKVGLLVLKRAIAPKIDEWALPGGFMEDNGESAEDGALRELFEETGIKISSKPRLVSSVSNQKGQLIIICESTELWMYDEKAIVLCRENSDFRIAWKPEELAFPIHTQAIKEWFEHNERRDRFCYTKDSIPHLQIMKSE